MKQDRQDAEKRKEERQMGEENKGGEREKGEKQKGRGEVEIKSKIKALSRAATPG